MTEAEYLAELERQQIAFDAAKDAYEAERERLMAEIMPRLAPFEAAINAVLPKQEQCLTIVECNDGSRPGFKAYIPGQREWWASKAWLRIAKWTDSSSDLWQWTLKLHGYQTKNRDGEIFLGNEGLYRDLKLQYPDIRKQAIDIIANAGWKILEEK